MVGCPLGMTDGCARGKVDHILAMKEQILIRFISDGTSWNSVNEGECLHTPYKVGIMGHCKYRH